ncbi:hypothetical protein HMPREF1051_1180 [Neisseria sicca VK64]|uniref:Uncharacterized protein n=1 Tax=Neisseria sicca VK64 TaxID=1095748 RepID=I2NLV9_NEISI|nr:hypothetical protein HMPREF1051_1180 [Neisseria sicca VK64]
MPRLAVLSVLSAASSPCPDLKLIHYILWLGINKGRLNFQTTFICFNRQICELCYAVFL